MRVDLNADLGEEITDDAGLLAVVTSASVACGFHAGNAEIMREVCALAVSRGVVIGAHVSYDDKPGFGRHDCDVAPGVLTEQIAEQVGTLDAIARAEGAVLAYLKPHGALYHRVGRDEEQAAAVLAGSGALPVLGMPDATILALAAELGRATFVEGFPDRGYLPDGRLIARGEPGALVTDGSAVATAAVRLAEEVDSVCVHGDSPDSVAHAAAVAVALRAAGVAVRPFVDVREA